MNYQTCSCPRWTPSTWDLLFVSLVELPAILREKSQELKNHSFSHVPSRAICIFDSCFGSGKIINPVKGMILKAPVQGVQPAPAAGWGAKGRKQPASPGRNAKSTAHLAWWKHLPLTEILSLRTERNVHQRQQKTLEHPSLALYFLSVWAMNDEHAEG